MNCRSRNTHTHTHTHTHCCVCAQLCLTLWSPVNCSPPGSSVHGIFQARILELVAITFSRGSSWPRDWTCVSCICCIGRWILYHSATREASVCMYIYKTECQRTDTFELWCWRRLLRVPWTVRRLNKSILKELNPEYSLEGLMLNLKLQYFDHLMWRTDSLEKTLMLGRLKVGGEGDNREWVSGWYLWCDGHEFE